MTTTGRYGTACLAVVGGVGAVSAALLDPPGTWGVLAAAAVAWPIQVASFAMLVRAEPGSNRFAAVWLGGTLVRMVVVGVAGWGLVVRPGLPPLPTLLALAGFFLVMLLLEPRFLGLGGHRGSS